MDILAESAVRVTVLAVGVAIVLRVLRIRAPWLAHAAWTGVVVIMLLLPVAVTWGPQFAVPLLPSNSASELLPSAAGDVAPIDPKTIATGASSATDMLWHVTWAAAVQGVYVAGVVLLVLRVVLGLRRSRAIRRDAIEARGRLTHPACVTPITVGVVAPAVILPADWESWDKAELSAVLDHEEEHVRRRDALVAVVALVNRAMFWFHPLAWWLPREISRLSEQACDAAVISRGHDREVYSSCLLRFARRVTDAGGRVAPMSMAMPGAGLGERLGMLAGPGTAHPSRSRLACAVVACAAIVVVCAAAAPTAVPAPGIASQVRNQVKWAVETSEHFDIFHNGLTADRVRHAVSDAEAAYAQLSAALKHDLSQQVMMVLVQRDRDLATAKARDFVLPSGEPARSRVVISLESLDHGAGILVHELTHQFAFDIVPDTSRLEPLLIEGLADYERGTWNTEDLRRTLDAAASVAIPPATSLAATDRHWAHLVFDCVDAQRGAEGVRRLLFALRARQTLDQALPMAFGITVDQFNQGFREYVTNRVGQR